MCSDGWESIDGLIFERVSNLIGRKMTEKSSDMTFDWCKHGM